MRLIGVKGGWPGKETTGSKLGGENNPADVKVFCPRGGEVNSAGTKGASTPTLERGFWDELGQLFSPIRGLGSPFPA